MTVRRGIIIEIAGERMSEGMEGTTRDDMGRIRTMMRIRRTIVIIITAIKEES